MIAAPPPPDETERLIALHDTALLDTPAEPPFDDLTRLASQICGTPMAAAMGGVPASNLFGIVL
ncbi:MAG: hypothetical protein B7Z51_02945 [Methyloversatilis sp. 12-65-5]|nr:MAG: hypothetical protein B7Z51_02945 [Methyloversatilis sp. 12-65-5]